MMSENDLCCLIEEAFAEAPKPAFGTLSGQTYDDEGTNAFFGRTDWRDHNTSGLRAHEPSLGFFTPTAFRYYLPAFVIASIRDPGRADVIPERIISELRHAASSRNLRWQVFSARERSALARFVEWWRDRIYPYRGNHLRERHKRVEITSLAKALDTPLD